MLQTAQRVGSAIGIAAVGSAFFSRLGSMAASSGSGGSGSSGSGAGDAQLATPYAHAFEYAILVAAAFVLIALVIALVDIVVNRVVATDDEHTSHRPTGAAAEFRPAVDHVSGHAPEHLR